MDGYKEQFLREKILRLEGEVKLVVVQAKMDLDERDRRIQELEAALKRSQPKGKTFCARRVKVESKPEV